MTDAESYVVSARQLLSSKHVPDSGRVCSWRKPRVCPSSCRMIPVSVQGGMLPNEAESTRMLREARGESGKNARARYGCPLTGRTSNTTLLLLAVQFESWPLE